jgi:hypothetical protein
MAAKKRRKRRTRDGKVGTQIFQAVESMVADQKISRSEAFRRLAEKSGRNKGTVAANFYRVARQRGVKLRGRRRGPGRPPGSGRGRAAGTGRVLTRAMAVLRELDAIIRKQGAELNRLRQENARFDTIRRLVGRI